jgi:zinc/manganese transport system permease protein
MPGFLAHAWLAGSGVGLAAGLVGYFLVVRGQVFTGDALSHVAFTGALAALAVGLDARWGLFAVTVLVALGMGALGRRGRPDDVVIGGVFAWILGLGVFFLAWCTRSGGGGNGTASVAVLFGSVFGLSAGRAAVTAGVALAIALALLAIARPLLFASLDPAVAAARGVPVRLLGLGFLVLVGGTAAEATQVVGALLILGLLAGPAGAAVRLTDRPLRGLALSAGIAVGSVLLGLAAAYLVPVLPPSFAIMAVVAGAYLVACAAGRRRGQVPGEPVRGALAYTRSMVSGRRARR